MLSSAAKLGLALLASWMQGGLTPREQQAWSKIQPAIAYVGRDAVCVLIDDTGLFLGQKDAIRGNEVVAVAGTQRVTLKRLGEDSATGLVVFQASPWTYGQAKPVYLPEKSAVQGQALFVALPNGPIKAELVRSDRIAVLTASHRMFPVNELKFEAPESAVAGGMVITQNGELVGAVSATLRNDEANAARSGGGGISAADALGNQLNGGAQNFGAPKLLQRQIGPGDLTVAYTVGLGVMRRVVEGFKSPAHQVQHPTIGIFCKDYLGGGALVTALRDDSTAAKAGMQVGDVILSIDGAKIRSQIGFASTMLQKEVGQTLVVWVLRNSLQVRLSIPVGKS